MLLSFPQVSKTSKDSGYAVSPDLRRKVEKYNWADTMLYRALNHTLWYRVDHAIGFQEELKWLQVSTDPTDMLSMLSSAKRRSSNLHHLADQNTPAMSRRKRSACAKSAANL